MGNNMPPIDDENGVPLQPKREPMFNAPLSMVLLSGGLVALYFLYSVQSDQVKNGILIDYALFPERFFAEAGSGYAYDGWIGKALPFIGHGLLHADWAHVLMNSVFALAFASGVVRVLGWWRTLLVYAGAQIGGALLYLYLSQLLPSQASIAVGASGAVSGLTGAAFLFMAQGHFLSRQFGIYSAVFLVGNVMLALAGPALLGSAIAWEAHVGGYIVGALMALGFSRDVAES
ncbi:rhomboid family intramembrane serine protease [Hirschia litorea]|uniref:Rhomboid family intramembrane serine protease n=1 Tax=Hirschia litorea TaxID=1199156 RepID=A0ABW2ILZ7_9PROT